MERPVFRILSLCFLWISASPVFAAGEGAAGVPPEVNEVLARLEERISGLRTLRADFVQEKHLAVLDEPLVLSGTLSMQKPDRFSWIVKEAAPVLDGHRRGGGPSVG